MTREQLVDTDRPLRLSFKSKQTVVVEADNDDRFCTTVQEAARACKAHEASKEWAQVFNELLVDLNSWCGRHGGVVQRCLVTWGEGGLHVFVVTQGDQYRFDFDDHVTLLNLRLAKAYPRHPTEIVQIPDGEPEALRSLFSPERCLQVYGQSTSAPKEV